MSSEKEIINGRMNARYDVFEVVFDKYGRKNFKLRGYKKIFDWIDPIYEWGVGNGRILIIRDGMLISEGYIVRLELAKPDDKKDVIPIYCFEGLQELFPGRGEEIKNYERMLHATSFKKGDQIEVEFEQVIGRETIGWQVYIEKECAKHIKLRFKEQQLLVKKTKGIFAKILAKLPQFRSRINRPTSRSAKRKT